MRRTTYIFFKKRNQTSLRKPIKCFKTDFLTEERTAQVCYLALKTVTYAQRMIHKKSMSNTNIFTYRLTNKQTKFKRYSTGTCTDHH